MDSRVELSGHFPVEECRLVVISRYVSTRWLAVLEQLRRQGTTLAYFMDDDLFDLWVLQGLPWGLRWKIVTRAYLHRRPLLKLCSEFWVSTPYLADKYADFSPVLLSPLPRAPRLRPIMVFPFVIMAPRTIGLRSNGWCRSSKPFRLVWTMSILRSSAPRQ